MWASLARGFQLNYMCTLHKQGIIEQRKEENGVNNFHSESPWFTYKKLKNKKQKTKNKKYVKKCSVDFKYIVSL